MAFKKSSKTTNETKHCLLGGDQFSSPLVDQSSPKQEPTAFLKQFQVKDFLTNTDNELVIKQFILFATALAFFPIATFFVFQHICILASNRTSDGSVCGLITSCIVVVSLMAVYAYKAYKEEEKEYFSHQSRHQEERVVPPTPKKIL